MLRAQTGGDAAGVLELAEAAIDEVAPAVDDPVDEALDLAIFLGGDVGAAARPLMRAPFFTCGLLMNADDGAVDQVQRPGDFALGVRISSARRRPSPACRSGRRPSCTARSGSAGPVSRESRPQHVEAPVDNLEIVYPPHRNP